MAAVATHHEFALPRGYVDASGAVHADGVIRLATVRDELEPLDDPAVRRNEAYLRVLRLSRTLVRIGEITDVTPDVVQGLFAADFDHLQRLYEQLNTDDAAAGAATCPDCRRRLGAGDEAVAREAADRSGSATPPALPVSDEAARWLSGGEVPGGLVPLLGDPAFPGADAEPEPATAEPPQPASAPPAEAELLAPEREPARLVASVVDERPLLRLARTPRQPPAAVPAVSAAPVDARELARASGGELSGDGLGTSTVTFPPPPPPRAAAPAPSAAVAPGAREQHAELDVDELYDGFLQRLRRDLLHDRERLGDLLGPMR